jgi:hypothetical protein
MDEIGDYFRLAHAQDGKAMTREDREVKTPC